MHPTFRERRLGKIGPVVGPIGIGTWALGGPFFSGEGCAYPTGAPLGYGAVDDKTSERAIHCALDLGARLFDTADAYGTGHAERLLGRALADRRHQAVIATKFGNTFHAPTRELTGTDVSPGYIRTACQASLSRLKTDWIDLYQLHVGELPAQQAADVAGTLEDMCDEGLIGAYAWSTDDPACAALFAAKPRGVAMQFDMNVFEDAPAMLEVCDEHEVAGLIRAPLAMGFLTGKFSSSSELAADDIRSRPPAWLRYFQQGGASVPEWNQRLDAIRGVLTSAGRTPAQGALAWIWARHRLAIPIPGARTAAQVEENLGAAEFGPLSSDQMCEIDAILRRR
ncbi:MAG: aldo/keto reductase [Alphaproteobacteria bacterium]|nr:aldo/keto reductase [Alphaproteobacteria bacterium]